MTVNSGLQVLHLSADENSESHFRILVDGQSVKYLTVDAGVYEIEDMCFPSTLASKLPPLPAGDWNLGHICKDKGSSQSKIDWIVRKDFSGIRNLWHPTQVDYLALALGNMYMSNVYQAQCDRFDSPVIVKFARFPYEINWYNAETEVYSWIKGHDIGPDFLGHVTEGDRVIGFLLEQVKGRHASIEDLGPCRATVGRLHELGIIHGDLNKHNFLVEGSRATLVDFEVARKSCDKDEMAKEMQGLEQQLRDVSGRGWRILEGAQDGDT